MKKDEIKQKRPFAPGIQWQLMLFIGGITLFTLLLVWGIITYALEPQYNRNIRAKLDSKAAAITALIDQSDAEISSRTYQGLYLNDEFWSGVSQTFRDKKINVDGNCVDFSDSTLRCLKAYESMYPCLLHESTGAFGGEFGYNLDTRIAIQLRQKLFQDGSLYQIVKIGSSMQMCVGRLSADGQYGVIVSASLAQITTAAEVLRAILGPVALILLVLDLLLAILFSRWFTNPIRKLSNGAQEIASGNYDVQIKVERHDEIGRLAEDFNHMAAEVKRSAQLEKDILANVSHDLRTPLTLIKGYAETVRDLTGSDDAKRTEQCNIIVDETNRGGFFIAGGGHGQHVGTTGHLGFKLPVPAQQFRQGGAGQPGSSTVDEDLAGIVGKKAGVGRNIIHPMAEHAQAAQWAHSAAEPLQAGTPGGKPGIAVFGQQAGAAVQAGH